ncbi:hypothetical protein VD0002_g4432 [Verticillium dahliae]|uniref:DUF602 domain-containing protein n=2 Tax=Verticillium dahliae TaxID=27337 RepID=G2XFE2_VERDV|nr:DUF602 domain-containing protein [Verticillium dahliae VdLs.17]KAF3347915.1 Sugar transporter STL1 [Verticillium dahliae VDG2]KAH6692052.1 DUF602 domain-containing protein [Verticillium dahliae]EGY18540.1 DUF602 domain-containing protein [Verticillium dahliae VdLs.17]PNH28493.1 hypothetical protein BJF96_g8210 [Verticillium dahliae]PNH50762.1 hypothetical protein VD0003_g6427 [Verticillium dahliae]
MGNDGGSIPKRRELVKNAARALTVSELKANAHESLTHAWSHDPLTNDPLDLDAVVSDWRGRLYNYESTLHFLLPAVDPAANTIDETQATAFAATAIHSLRDIVKLKFTRSGDKVKDARVCPVSLKELGPATRSVYLVPCGHVFADVGMKQIRENSCPECSEPFTSSNIIPILPVDEAETERMVRRMEDLRAAGLTHSLKKDKSTGKKKRKAEDVKDEASDKRQATEETSRVKKNAHSRTSGINNAFAADLTARVLAEQDELNKRRKLAARS